MKKSFLIFAFVGGLLTLNSCKNDKTEAGDAQEVATTSDDANGYVVDTANSTIEWVGSKPTGKHNGTIAISAGEVYLNNGKVESGKFTIDMTSITVLDLAAGDGKEDLEGHLKGLGKAEDADHFFNTNKYPEGVFEITSVNTVDGQTTIEGNLTLKEITKSVKFPATLALDGDSLMLTTETFTINRTDWNVNYGSKSIFDNLGDKFINDAIELKISVKASK
ncbi:YceI family protein [Flavobacterium sp. UBA6135]|uniref:YceI family protein n=1 Tax=Flavobacterium sp. UBA6135 TaxID=1946553 RepID=UPI0025C10617|nr:YceI family protein [Flavobacterium sp. UBA6135]